MSGPNKFLNITWHSQIVLVFFPQLLLMLLHALALFGGLSDYVVSMLKATAITGRKRK